MNNPTRTGLAAVNYPCVQTFANLRRFADRVFKGDVETTAP